MKKRGAEDHQENDVACKFICPECQRGELRIVLGSGPAAETVECPSCKAIVKLRYIKIKGPCGGFHRAALPLGSQPIECHYKDDRGAPDEVSITSNLEQHDIHIILIKGHNTSCSEAFFDPEHPKAGYGNYGTKPSPWLFMVTVGAGKVFERLYNRTHPGARTALWWKRLGEIIGAFITALCYVLLVPFFLFWGLGQLQHFSFWFALCFAAMMGATLYFAFLMAQELIIVTGELEIALEKEELFRLYDPLAFAFSNRLLIIGSICYCLLFSSIKMFGGSSDIPIVIDSLSIIATGVPFVVAAQVFVAFALLNYALHSAVKFRYPVTLLKRGYIGVAQTIEKLAEAEVYIVLFLASILFIYIGLVTRLTGGGLVSDAPPPNPQLESVFTSLRLLLVVIPLMVYFLYLSKFVSDAKYTEIRELNQRILAAWGIADMKTAETLSTKKTVLEAESRWILGASIGSRLVLLLFLSIQAFLITHV